MKVANHRRVTLVAGLLLCAGVSAFAQLDQNCTVNVLNRTVQVDSDGAWVLPNVPASLGLVRARAVCVENGVTRFGQSDLFSIPADGNISNIAIAFDAPAPIPAQITIAAPSSTLQTVGAPEQLTVTAALPDGTVQDDFTPYGYDLQNNESELSKPPWRLRLASLCYRRSVSRECIGDDAIGGARHGSPHRHAEDARQTGGGKLRC